MVVYKSDVIIWISLIVFISLCLGIGIGLGLDLYNKLDVPIQPQTNTNYALGCSINLDRPKDVKCSIEPVYIKELK